MSATQPLPQRCPMVGGTCSLQSQVQQQLTGKKPYAFVMLPYHEKFDDTEKVYKIVATGGKVLETAYTSKKLQRKKISTVSARSEKFVGEGTCKICQLCWFSDFGIAELGDINPNVMMEIGLMWGFGKKVIFTLHKGYTAIDDIPFDVGNQLLVVYQNLQKLGDGLDSKVKFILQTLR
jgi:hypothetical protein